MDSVDVMLNVSKVGDPVGMRLNVSKVDGCLNGVFCKEVPNEWWKARVGEVKGKEI